jgi:hypothetical protein
MDGVADGYARSHRAGWVTGTVKSACCRTAKAGILGSISAVQRREPGLEETATAQEESSSAPGIKSLSTCFYHQQVEDGSPSPFYMCSVDY